MLKPEIFKLKVEMTNFFPVGFLLSFLLCLEFFINSPRHTALAQFPEEDDFILSALSWITLRENGVIMDRNQLWPFMEEVKKTQSRVFIAAFEFGFLKRMTLNENDACDPTYPNHYKYWFNDTTTPYLLIRFVMNDYYAQYYPELGTVVGLLSTYCDYRQGLVCNKATRKCECPPGSKMSLLPSSPFPPLQRCLVKENEICAVLDMASTASINPTKEPLKETLAFLIFDPDRPLGCVEGTQCRFKSPNMVTPLCYSSAGSPIWVDEPPNIPYGEDCTLHLYASHGVCEPAYIYHKPICYNYGLPPTIGPIGTAPNKTGICSDEIGVFGGPAGFFGVSTHFGNEKTGKWHEIHIFLRGLLTPVFIPLRGEKLLNYHQNISKFEGYLGRYVDGYHNNGADQVGCSVDRTNRLRALYKVFLTFRSTLTSGKYVVDENTLDMMLAEAKDIAKEQFEYGHLTLTPERQNHVRICNVKGGGGKTCIPPNNTPYPDDNGNDGHCIDQPISEDKSFYDDDHVPYQTMFNNVLRFFENLNLTMLPHNHIFEKHRVRPTTSDWCYPLENCYSSHEGYCMEDYTDSDLNGDATYEDYTCNFVANYKPGNECKGKTLEASWEFGACEQVMLEEKIEEQLETIFENGDYKKLERGTKCNYNDEVLIRQAFKDVGSVNGYNFLRNIDKDSWEGGFCDSGKLLECKTTKTCECLDGTEARHSGDLLYRSDYCYLSAGNCKDDVTTVIPDLILLPTDKERMFEHYGDPEYIGGGYGGCENSNVCVFADFRNSKCTVENTGFTGVEPITTTTTTTTTPSPPGVTTPARPNPDNTIAPPTKYAAATCPFVYTSLLVILTTATCCLQIFIYCYNFL